MSLLTRPQHKDFFHWVYANMVERFQAAGLAFATFADYAQNGLPRRRHFLLRHDVDRQPHKALELARIEAEKNVRATYFFRAKPVSFRPDSIRAIADFGHDVGYHYEELADSRGNPDIAWEAFQRNLEQLRSLVPVSSIAMHGSPLSGIDNRHIWRKYDYRRVGISIEAYLDLDYTRYRYFSDTGGCWNSTANLRDRPPTYEEHPEEFRVHTTFQLVDYLTGPYSGHAIVSTHPERWARSWPEWFRVRTQDHLANGIKRALNMLR